MKKFISENMKLIITILCVILALLIVLSLFLITKNSESNTRPSGTYIIGDEVVELPGTKVITSESLKKEHCLENICVSDVVIYNANEEGRLECNVTNNTKDVKSGYFKLKFDDVSLIISYKKLESGKSMKSTAQYRGKGIGEVNDYILEELSKEEEKKIIK